MMVKQRIFYAIICLLGGLLIGFASANLKSMLGIFLLVSGIYLVISSILRMK